LEAGIAACHSTVATAADTPWPRILALYDQLLALAPSPIVALNRAVAVGRVAGPQAALDTLDAISARASLESYYLFHAVRGSLLAELRRHPEARAALQRAVALSPLPAERTFMNKLIAEIPDL